MTYYDIALEGLEQPVWLSMRNTSGRRIQEVGEPARIRWTPESILILEDA